MKLLFGSDLHGQTEQFRCLVAAARERKCDALLLGGDICPRLSSLAHVSSDMASRAAALPLQAQWVKDTLMPVLQASACPVVMIFGNTDAQWTVDEVKQWLQQQAQPSVVRILDNGWCELGPDVHLFGYPCVPPSDHRQKDWERWDEGHDVDPVKRMTVFSPKGFLSGSGAMEPTSLDPATSIRAELEHLRDDTLSLRKKNVKTLWMLHGPPKNTCADEAHDNVHVGSQAIRDLIAECQPLATFHGHIHESFAMSGRFRDHIGATSVFTSGHDFHKPAVACIEFDTDHPDDAQRLLLRYY